MCIRDSLSFYRSLDEHGKEDLETFAEAMSSNVHKRRLRMALERMNSVEAVSYTHLDVYKRQLGNLLHPDRIALLFLRLLDGSG